MSPEQIALVQNSFKDVKALAPVVTEMFYNRLFQLDPSTKSLFKGDPKEQQRVLMDTLEILTKGLSVQQVILPALRELGKRHASYGVNQDHYATFGSALLWSLEKGLGRMEFNPYVQEAWSEAYDLISEVMQEGAGEGVETSTLATTLQSQIEGQQKQLEAQQQQIDATNQLVTEIQHLHSLLQQGAVPAPTKSPNGVAWWKRLFGGSRRS